MDLRNKYNTEGYLDLTAYLGTKYLENKRTPLNDDWVFKRGDIYLANLDPYVGSEQGGVRPVVVLQNNTGNFYCPTLIVAPLTSQIDKRRDLPIHYYAETIRGMLDPSIVLLEQIRTIDKQRIRKYLGKMSSHQMDEISEVIKTSLGIYISEDLEAP